jgi:hypothetical protein
MSLGLAFAAGARNAPTSEATSAPDLIGPEALAEGPDLEPSARHAPAEDPHGGRDDAGNTPARSDNFGQEAGC